jgi:hypothetical protein
VRGLSRRRSFDVVVSGAVLAILGAPMAMWPARHGEEQDPPAVARVQVAAVGAEARLRIPYADQVFQLSDAQHVPDARDLAGLPGDAIVSGGPGLATVLACCSLGDADATIALRERRPPAPSAWPESAETDLDLPSGHLAISTTNGLLAVAELPSGAYRLRVSGRGARELQQRRERFLIELWRRRG